MYDCVYRCECTLCIYEHLHLQYFTSIAKVNASELSNDPLKKSPYKRTSINQIPIASL